MPKTYTKVVTVYPPSSVVKTAAGGVAATGAASKPIASGNPMPPTVAFTGAASATRAGGLLLVVGLAVAALL